jgi:hypothetical protein
MIFQHKLHYNQVVNFEVLLTQFYNEFQTMRTDVFHWLNNNFLPMVSLIKTFISFFKVKFFICEFLYQKCFFGTKISKFLIAITNFIAQKYRIVTIR